jgi:lysophospholipase L1-like esterase
MSRLSPAELKCPDWHGTSAGAPARRMPVAEFVLPVVVIGVLAWFQAWIMAAVVAAIAGLLITLRFANPRARRAVDRGLAVFAEWAGRVVAAILLAIPFFGWMTLMRLLHRLTGNDPLHLRDREAPTYWLPSDVESRRARHIRSMFCSERVPRGKLALLPLCLLGLLLAGATELGLRVYGYGSPILYVQDPDIGYYPLADQKVRYPGRVISINNHGMRAPDIRVPGEDAKLRILMIGDSTLAGTRVSNDELYTSLLEKRLNEAAGTPTFEVLNMGVNAWGPLHEQAFLAKFGSFGADVVVICGPVANVFRPRYGLERLPFSPASQPPRFALQHVAYELMWRVREQTLGPQPWGIPGPIQDKQAHEGTHAYVGMAADLQARGVEVMMEMLPARHVTLSAGEDPDGARMFEPIRKRMAEIGVTANCAGPIFKDAGEAAGIYYDGVHFDRLGHRLYAEYLAERLQSESREVRQAIDR